MDQTPRSAPQGSVFRRSRVGIRIGLTEGLSLRIGNFDREVRIGFRCFVKRENRASQVLPQHGWIKLTAPPQNGCVVCLARFTRRLVADFKISDSVVSASNEDSHRDESVFLISMPTRLALPRIVGKKLAKVCSLVDSQSRRILEACLSKPDSTNMVTSLVHLKGVGLWKGFAPHQDTRRP